MRYIRQRSPRVEIYACHIYARLRPHSAGARSICSRAARRGPGLTNGVGFMSLDCDGELDSGKSVLPSLLCS